MESESCQSNVAICDMQPAKKIEPDSRNPNLHKTVLGIATSLLPGITTGITPAIRRRYETGNQGKRCSVFYEPVLLISGFQHGKISAAKLAESTPLKAWGKNAKASTAQSVTFLDRFYHSNQISPVGSFLSCGNLVGVATPSPPFAACAA